ncbi:DUF4430 domain-containing protein [Pelotomaculum propionicicum]|uniref:Transcobalamin-like C-terminal domain-containing protein n=1 Tax=Pelotomaculum propionicicum TaxID=258475 RepID=A0A4Y7RNZ1_9FIRM|nr:DUF4430 domain-containing protein [Pelotomaculum propionicicum]TEB10392.1 hypothetical protein Pmgp_02404 [Pelotomaculum propionicicum]
MKRKLIYFIALLIILAVSVGPALYMHKVFSSNQQYKQAENTGINAKEQGGAANQNQPAAGAGQISPESDKGLPDTEAKQGDPAPQQQAAASSVASRESTASAPSGDTVAVTASAPSGDAATVTSPAVSPESGCTVWIAVVGKNGGQLFQAGQVVVKKDNKWGITALGALDATGLSYTTMPTWPDFVSSVSGQANSGVSGWMYSVNGDVPMHMADKHPVKAGDKVIWWYSDSMEQPQPQWDDLI